jgi:hypothetical protein
MAEKLAHRIREIVTDLDQFTIQDLVEPLHIQTFREKERVRSAVKGLRKIRDVVSIMPGVFCYRPKQKPFSMLAKMWRAMLIKGTFTWREIVVLSGADKTHVHKYIMFLSRARYIERISRERSYARGIYRVADPDHAPLEHPRMPVKRRRKP